MKKQTALTLALLLALGGLAACSASREKQSEKESTVQTGENVADESFDSLTQTGKSVIFIGEDRAKDVISKYADAAVATIDFKKIELDEDEGVWKYDVEFSHNGASYEAELNATSGEIIEWETKE